MSQLVSCTYCHVVSPLPWSNDRCPNCGGEAATIPVDPAPIAIPGYAPAGVIQGQYQSLWEELKDAKDCIALLSRECDRLEAENAAMRARMANSPNLVRKRRCG
jgi:hypothetical protein